MTKFLVICNNPRIASTKTQSIFCNKNVFFLRKDKFQKHEHFMISKSRYLSFLETKIRLKTLKPLKNKRSWNFTKNCQERGDRSLISHPSLFKTRVKTFWNSKLSSTDFYIWYLKLTSRFKTRTLKLAFSKFQPWSNTKVKKTYKSKVYTCNKALKHLPQILFCLLTTPYSHGNVVVQKKGY